MLARKGLLALVLASRLLRALLSEDIMSLLSPHTHTHTAPRGKVAPARLRGRAVCKVRRTAGQLVLHVGSSVAAAIVLHLPKLESKV